MTIGVRGQRGDWDEAKGQRLLWQPLHLAFAPNGDIYIGEGHANESPNDADKSPTNSVGAARVLHLDKNGKFINQWFGNHAGQGHFSMVHGIAVNPDNGNVYIGDREEYRLVVYDAHGKFVKTIQMRNLTCALYVDPHKQLWLATGQDGQIFKIDWDGNVLGAIGNGPGNGDGQFPESTLHGDGRAGQSLRGRHRPRACHDDGYGAEVEVVDPGGTGSSVPSSANSHTLSPLTEPANALPAEYATTYCLPLRSNTLTGAFMPAPVWNSQSFLPSRTSSAVSRPSLRPTNARPPAVTVTPL